jgi:hypothetical protein
MRRTVGARFRRSGRTTGQTLAEFAIVFPIVLLVILGIIVIGLWIFYQQQVTNVAREAARYAAIHSSTAPCPTASWRDPQAPPVTYPAFPYHCDGPANPNDTYPWPQMTDFARRSVWGTAPTRVFLNACWSGHVPPDVDVSAFANYSAAAGFPLADHPAVEADGSGGQVVNQFVQCHIAGVDPTTASESLACASGMTSAADDPASDIPFNQVTVYACFDWTPPMAGFLLMPNTITMRAVVTEVIQRQQ